MIFRCLAAVVLFASIAVTDISVDSAVAATVDPNAPTIASAQIVESSGLAASPTRPDVFWTLNDSNNPPLLFALGVDGETRATVRVAGVQNRDWEAVTAWQEPAGGPMLAIGDIGDNAAARSEIRVELLEEPALGRQQSTVRPLRTIRLRYPDTAVDAETLLVDATGQHLYVVDKSLLSATVWVVPQSHFPGTAEDVGVLEKVGMVPFPLVTDGVMLDDGQVLLRNYGSLALVSSATGEPRLLGTTNPPEQRQPEGVTVLRSNGPKPATVLLSSEGAHSALLSLPLPELLKQMTANETASAATASVSDSVTLASSDPTASARTDVTSSSTPTDQRRWWQRGASAVLVIVLVTMIFVVGRRLARTMG